MGLIDDCQQQFNTKDLYGVLEVEKDAKEGDIKKSYRRLSLKWHPDRHADASEEKRGEITKKFQTLSKVHFILSDDDKRAYYDNTGSIVGEDNLDSEANWDEYWRVLFPKVTVKDIDSFFAKYTGSEEERNDLKKVYCQYDGDMDKISESMIGFDEERHREMLEEMIKSEDVPEFEAFTNETARNKERRAKKIAKESKLAEKEAKKREEQGADDDLVNAIQSRSKGNYDSMVSALEAKYANAGNKRKATAPKKLAKKVSK